MSLLSSEIVEIKANGRFATYRTLDGKIFIMGRDFRERNNLIARQHDLVYGLP